MAYIYKTTNAVNKKIYIGKSKHENPAYLGSGIKISAAIKKYGVESFSKEIIEECQDSIVNVREIFWINYYQSTVDTIGYNISKGGNGGDHYWSTLSAEEQTMHRQKISQGRKGKSTGPRSTETRKKQSLKFNRDPEFLKVRADAKRKLYTCVNHLTLEIFVTKNLKEFCKEKNINFGSMQHNARTRKTFSNGCWSCRQGTFTDTPETVIEKLNNEVASATIDILSKISNVAKTRTGEKNANAKKIALQHESGQIVNFNGNFFKDSKALTGFGYHTMKKLIDGSVKTLHGWKLI